MKKEILTSLRVQRGLTQADLAKVLGVAASTVSMYEQGRREPDNEKLIKLAKFFHVSVDYLMGEEQGAQLFPGDEQELLQFVRQTVFSPDFSLGKLRLSDADREIIVESLRIGLRVVEEKHITEK